MFARCLNHDCISSEDSILAQTGSGGKDLVELTNFEASGGVVFLLLKYDISGSACERHVTTHRKQASRDCSSSEP